MNKYLIPFAIGMAMATSGALAKTPEQKKNPERICYQLLGNIVGTSCKNISSILDGKMDAGLIIKVTKKQGYYKGTTEFYNKDGGLLVGIATEGSGWYRDLDASGLKRPDTENIDPQSELGEPVEAAIR